MPSKELILIKDSETYLFPYKKKIIKPMNVMNIDYNKLCIAGLGGWS
jgi:hypothetical protein